MGGYCLIDRASSFADEGGVDGGDGAHNGALDTPRQHLKWLIWSLLYYHIILPHTKNLTHTRLKVKAPRISDVEAGAGTESREQRREGEGFRHGNAPAESSWLGGSENVTVWKKLSVTWRCS